MDAPAAILGDCGVDVGVQAGGDRAPQRGSGFSSSSSCSWIVLIEVSGAGCKIAGEPWVEGKATREGKDIPSAILGVVSFFICCGMNGGILPAGICG
ncbi:hypothetical protein FKM82_018613 [Ascaphus truei]